MLLSDEQKDLLRFMKRYTKLEGEKEAELRVYRVLDYSFSARVFLNYLNLSVLVLRELSRLRRKSSVIKF